MGTTIFINSCKHKSDPVPSTNTTSTPQSSQTSDQSVVNDATSHVADETNKAVSSDNSLSGRLDATTDLPCNVVVTTVAGDAYSRKLTFNGPDCNGTYNRTGVAIVKLVPASVGGKWKDAGSKLVITLQDLKIVEISSSNYVILNGSQTITNINGGNWLSLILGQQLNERVRGNYNVTFSNNTVRAWQEAKVRSLQFTASTTSFKYTLNGDSTLASTGTELVSDWGKNSNNDNFITTITDLMVIQNCSGSNFKFTGGIAKHYIPQGTLTVKFSSNSLGATVNSCDATGYFLSWLGTTT